jgi:hypothetical protein
MEVRDDGRPHLPDGGRRARPPSTFELRVSLFCRHNRFVADCPICSKGTVLDPNRKPERRPRPSSTGGRRGGSSRSSSASATRVSRGPFAAAGPYEDGRELRLEKVPGGLRLAAWQAGQLLKEAPVLALGDLPGLVRSAAEQGLLAAPELAAPELAAPDDRGGGAPVGAHGASPGRTGELRDELRVERLEDDRVRIARWIMRPNRGWELQESPVLLPGDRFAGALGAAARSGVLAAGDPVE